MPGPFPGRAPWLPDLLAMMVGASSQHSPFPDGMTLLSWPREDCGGYASPGVLSSCQCGTGDRQGTQALGGLLRVHKAGSKMDGIMGVCSLGGQACGPRDRAGNWAKLGAGLGAIGEPLVYYFRSVGTLPVLLSVKGRSKGRSAVTSVKGGSKGRSANSEVQHVHREH